MDRFGLYFAALAAAGGSADGRLRILAQGAAGRSVFLQYDATSDPDPGSAPLIRVPAPLVITAAQASRSDIVSRCALQLDGAATSSGVLLALLILTERARGAESQWAWYIDALPRAGSNGLFLSQTDLDALAGTPVRRAVDAKLRQLQRQYAACQGVLEHWQRASPGRGPVSFDAFKWATFVVLSRAISLQSFFESTRSARPACYDGDDQALVPVLDMLNHSSQPNAFWTVDADGSVSVFADSCSTGPTTDSVTGSATGSATGPVTGDGSCNRQLTELHLSYGEKPATEWLYEHGFVPLDNQHDVWPYFVEMQGSPELVAVKILWFRELGLLPRIMLAAPDSDGHYRLPRADLLALCLAELDDSSDACGRAVGKVCVEAPYFAMDGTLIDDDEKLLALPGLQTFAVGQCAARLSDQAAAMRAQSCAAPAAAPAVQAYLRSSAALLDKIADRMNH
ncbi:hypothetical protein GGF46_001374 [Coemansia sp. RSA 552]|nr:hypothetical protein GGF46_001374 [Coemansia sp. RSA 552]